MDVYICIVIFNVLKVYYNVETFIPPAFPIVTTGTFDGVHNGHMQILNRIKSLAKKGEERRLWFHLTPIHDRLFIRIYR